MEIRCEVSNKSRFLEIYKEFIDMNPSVVIDEDEVSYGFEVPDQVIVGIVFVLQNIQGNVMWDAIKLAANKALSSFHIRKQDRILIEIEKDGNRYSVSLPQDVENISIEIPNELKLERK